MSQLQLFQCRRQRLELIVDVMEDLGLHIMVQAMLWVVLQPTVQAVEAGEGMDVVLRLVTSVMAIETDDVRVVIPMGLPLDNQTIPGMNLSSCLSLSRNTISFPDWSGI